MVSELTWAAEKVCLVVEKNMWFNQTFPTKCFRNSTFILLNNIIFYFLASLKVVQYLKYMWGSTTVDLLHPGEICSTGISLSGRFTEIKKKKKQFLCLEWNPERWWTDREVTFTSKAGFVSICTSKIWSGPSTFWHRTAGTLGYWQLSRVGAPEFLLRCFSMLICFCYLDDIILGQKTSEE